MNCIDIFRAYTAKYNFLCFTNNSTVTGYQKVEIQKRKIVETAEISIDERISIISEIFAIVNKKNTDVT
jgi:hypothetical protein